MVGPDSGCAGGTVQRHLPSPSRRKPSSSVRLPDAAGDKRPNFSAALLRHGRFARGRGEDAQNRKERQTALLPARTSSPSSPLASRTTANSAASSRQRTATSLTTWKTLPAWRARPLRPSEHEEASMGPRPANAQEAHPPSKAASRHCPTARLVEEDLEYCA